MKSKIHIVTSSPQVVKMNKILEKGDKVLTERCHTLHAGKMTTRIINRRGMVWAREQ